jgi:hypothetical protein
LARPIYSTISSLDGYITDEKGNFDWAAPDEEVHSFVNDLERSGDSADRRAPVGILSSPWLYIQSEALQGVAAHLGPVESVHLKKIRGTLAPAVHCREREPGGSMMDHPI